MKKAFQITGIAAIFFALLIPQFSYGQAKLKVGDIHDGGIVFSVDGSGQSVLICQTRDLGKMDWADAVAACRNLGNGWRLPTKDELESMYVNLHRKRRGGFEEDYYWSSTDQGDETDVWDQNFDDGDPNFGGKVGYDEYVRAVKNVSLKKQKGKANTKRPEKVKRSGGAITPVDNSKQSFGNTLRSKVFKLNNATIKGPTDDGFNLTFVKSTGVAWLDATLSQNHTTPQIKTRMADPNDELYGFRYATGKEVEALMESYGLPGNGEVTGDGPALSFMKDFGDLGPGYQTMVGQSIDLVWPVREDLNQSKQIIAQTKNNKSSVSQGGADPNKKRNHFLVFDSPMIPHNDSSFKKSPSSENNMTFDSRTGFSWLDVAFTYNHSVQEIDKRIKNSNDELYGFQYAIYDDVEKMLAGYGIPLNGGEVSGTSQGFSFIKDFDKIRSGNRTMIGPSNGGIFYARADLGQSIQVIAHTTDDENGKVSSATTSGRSADKKYPHDGHLLFKKR